MEYRLMSTEMRSSELARKIVIGVFKTILPATAERISTISDIVDTLSNARTTFWDRKDLSRRLEAVTDKLARRLSHFDATEFRNLPENEKNASMLAVCTAIEDLNLTKRDVIREDSDPGAVFARLLPQAQQQWNAALVSEAGMQYGRIFLKEASLFLVNLVRDLPDFTKDVVIENLSLTRRVHSLLERSVDSVVLPGLRPGTNQELSSFEADYRSEVIHRNKDLELFGVHIPVPELRRQPLDIAYISLTASGTEIYQAKLSRDRFQPIQPVGPRTAKVDMALGIIARRIKNQAAQSGRPGRGGVKVLITGQAGSGKTTLAQWLVVRAAESNFPEELQVWNSYLPVIAKFRTIFRGEESVGPTDDDLFAAAAYKDSHVPGDWFSRVLSNRNVLLVLDGLDELAVFHRSKARTWLEIFMRRYPSVNILITSRPDAVDNRWFSEHGYVRLDLQPMSLADIRRCINSWFDAVSSVAPEQQDDLSVHRRSLMSDVERRPVVQELAETPLVCAMLCAFYAYTMSMSAPESRGELYQQVIDTLVDTRDRTRKAIDPERRRFTLKEKLTLLQALARHMTEHQLAEIQVSTTSNPRSNRSLSEQREPNALSIIEEEIRGLPAMSLSARETLDYLLQRSVIFREVAPNVAQFAHRSLQEFLTGRSFAKTGSALTLLNYLGIGGWDRIITFAASSLDQTAATQLISAILDMTQTAKESQRSVLLLAAECLSTAAVNPELADRASRMLKAILPPASLSEAELIGRSGDGVIRWLAGYESQSDAVVAACIRAAAVNGSPVGLGVIVSYLGRITSPKLKEELINDWHYFEPSEYAEEVLARIQLDDCLIILSSGEILDAASALTSLRRIKVDTRSGTIDFRRWRNLRNLSDLDCTNFYRLETLDGISVLANLRRLSLIGRSKIISFEEISGLRNLRELYLDGCTGLTNADPIASVKSIQVLSLNGCSGVTEFDWLADLPELRTLSLNDCRVASLSFCGQLQQLRTLRAQVAEGVSDRDIADIGSCANLRRLELRLARGRSRPIVLPNAGQLRSVTITGEVTIDDIRSLSKCGELTELATVNVRGLKDFTVLQKLSRLRTLSLRSCDNLVSSNGIEALSRLVSLDLSGSAIRYLDIPGTFSTLVEINLDRCASLGSVSDLVLLPSLRVLKLPPIGETTLDELTALARENGNHALEIFCDPIPDLTDTG